MWQFVTIYIISKKSEKSQVITDLANGTADRKVHKFVWLLSANHWCVLCPATNESTCILYHSIYKPSILNFHELAPLSFNPIWRRVWNIRNNITMTEKSLPFGTQEITLKMICGRFPLEGALVKVNPMKSLKSN